MLCPCRSGNEFNQCCEPILRGVKAETAEKLMRARYTAYTMVNMDFIKASHDPATRNQTNWEENRAWAEQTQWEGLEILDTEKGGPEDKKGFVEFKAHFASSDSPGVHHEISEFNKKNGTWYFTTGKSPQSTQIINSEPKVGRNDPCSCGSGKKYKKCCGRT